jgi:hypothetical protein
MTKNRSVVLGLIALGLAACSSGSANDATPAGSANPSSSGAAASAPAPVRERERESSSRTAAAGTSVEVTIRDEISSRQYSAGHAVEGSVSRDVVDSKGRVVIPAGSGVSLEITKISPSNAGDTRGEIPHTMKGRGVTKGEATDVGVGAAAGALVGQLIGKNTKGTVIGGAVGAVGGGAVAVAGAQRDIVVAPGTHVTFALPQAITVK